MDAFLKMESQLRELAKTKMGAVADAFNQAADIAESYYFKTRDAAKNEPPPTPGEIEVLPELIADLQARSEMGRRKYGTTLHTHNGRDTLNDALQESIDLTMYLKQLVLERG